MLARSNRNFFNCSHSMMSSIFFSFNNGIVINGRKLNWNTILCRWKELAENLIMEWFWIDVIEFWMYLFSLALYIIRQDLNNKIIAYFPKFTEGCSYLKFYRTLSCTTYFMVVSFSIISVTPAWTVTNLF